LCRQAIADCEVYIVKNDDFTISELGPYLSSFSAIVIGPGPGSPDNPQDIGVVKHLWKLGDEYTLPIFGVCLGLQSLAIEFGAHLKRLSVVKHGQVSRINHHGTEIFEGVGRIDAVRYHSLHVQLLNGGMMEELAWADDGSENGRVVMAVKHKIKPFWAVQYHPESVRTSGGGKDVLQNFWKLAKLWNSDRRIKPWGTGQSERFPAPWPRLKVRGAPTSPRSSVTTSVKNAVLNLPELTVLNICELLGVHHEPSSFVVLDSAAKPGRFSIVGALMPSSPHITYNIRDQFVRLKANNKCRIEPLEASDIWTWVASFMRPRKVLNGNPDIPFWGGLVGYLSYELGVDRLSVRHGRKLKGNKHPDLNLVFVERSIVIDTVTGDLHVQSLRPNDGQWIADMISTLKKAATRTSLPTSTQPTISVIPTVTLPDQKLYKSRINMAKERLFSGDSYELCLTSPTRISFPTPPNVDNQSISWTLYKHLRKTNPAPHSAYLRLHPTTLLSSSPERFLSFSRPPHPVCQLRPIKGTVRKGPGVTRAVAEELLIGSPKEVGSCTLPYHKLPSY
jgi:para-aminobenzoate synthetase